MKLFHRTEPKGLSVVRTAPKASVELPPQLFFMRHGEYDRHPRHETFGRLTRHGREAVLAARRVVNAYGLGAEALVLTSPAPRCVESAQLLAGNNMRVAEHDLLEEVGECPKILAEFGGLVPMMETLVGQLAADEQALAAMGIVAVTHKDLALAIKRSQHSAATYVDHAEVVVFHRAAA